MNKLHQKKLLSAVVSMLMATVVCQSVSVHASDIEIYSAGFTPNPVVMFALDNSGSMSSNPRRAYDLKDSMQAVLLGEGVILPARNVLAGLSTFDNPSWYPIYSGNGASTTELYKTAVHPDTTQVEVKTNITVPRTNAGYIASPVQMLDDRIVYPTERKDMFPSNGDVIFKDGTGQPTATGGEVVINTDKKKVYIRFQVDVPRGSTINAAYLELRSATDSGANKLKVKVAKNSKLYVGDPSITNLQTFAGNAGNKTIATDVNNTYLTNIFNISTTQTAKTINRNYYKQDNVSNRNNMYVYSMDVKAEMEDLIKSNTSWCGMGDVVIELSQDNSKNYTFYANREDRVNPKLYIDWTLTDNTKRTNNCMFTDTKRLSTKKVTNLGNVGTLGSMTARQSMNLQIQRMLTNTRTPYSALLAETAAYMLGNGTKPISANIPNTSIADDAVSGITKGEGNDIKYVSPIKRVRDYLTNPTDLSRAAAYQKEQQCGQHGLYFLTDGEEDPRPNVTDLLFKSAIFGGGAPFTCSNNETNKTSTCPIQISGALAKSAGYTANNRSLKIKTSTVGFNIDNANYRKVLSDMKDASGGQYTSVSSGSGTAKADIVNSIGAFLDDIFDNEIPETVTGSPTLPQDALNPLRVQPYGYYASFTPKLNYQLWAGNINKYNIVNGALVGNGVNNTSIFKVDGSLDTSVLGLWAKNAVNGFAGLKGALELGIDGSTASDAVVKRNVLTNRKIVSGIASEQNTLSQVDFISDYLKTDPKQKYWLNVLGYNEDTTVLGTADLTQYIGKTADLRQVGAAMHSTPILLTQSGTISSDLSTTNRKDYLLFGSTQGLLHMVDSSNGKEVFAFAPHEMMEKQPNAFLDENQTEDMSQQLFYGIDAPWAAYTEYVNNTNGSLTVGQSNYVSTDKDKITGKQWVYGGLRMGGRSYYALDLTHVGDTNKNIKEMDKQPKLKFHIDPEHNKIYQTGITEPLLVSALGFMGESWSKPTLAYVKFGGEKKLVMFVGGGYSRDSDNGAPAGYENTDYDQANKKGAGVYMFDADNGKLLWWASANATSAQGAEASTEVSTMKYSVVSQINAIDRDNDGLVDNLYFGDLGGQAFRVDLNNAAVGTGATAETKIADQKANFATRAVRLFEQHAANGASPRFYEMPSFSVHRDSALGLYGVIAFSSGNRSSPLSGTVGGNGPVETATTSADDGVFVVYDKDVGKSTLYTSNAELTVKDVKLENLKDSYKMGVEPYKQEGTGAAVTKAGWFYRYGNGVGAGKYKGMNSIYAVDSILYANVFYRDGVGSGSDSCGAGVKGDSYLYRFCLPTGLCPSAFNSFNQTGDPDKVKLGAGILGSGLGSSGANTLQNTVSKTIDCSTVANKNKIECQEFTTAGKIRTLRWYETR